MRGTFLFFKAVAVAAAAAFCLIFVYALYASSVFPRGERYEYYTGTSSEDVYCSRSPLGKLAFPQAKGECAFYSGDKVEELKQRFGAQVLFVEEAAGTVNYYCYSPVFDNGVALNGYTVNLHLAFNGERTAAGTPVIFGGY